MRNFTLEKNVPIKLMVFERSLDMVEIKNYELTFTLSTDTTEYEDAYLAQIDQNLSFSKVMYFLENVINQSFVYEKESSEEVNKYLATTFNNNLMLLPTVEENSLITALHCKLNSITSRHTSIERIVLKDTELQLNYEYYCDEDEYIPINLPTIKEWMGELSYWKDPWWARSDASTFDNFAESKEELEKWHEKVESGEYIENPHTEAFELIEEEIKQLFKAAKESKEGDPDEEAEVIEVDFANKKKKWIPRVV